VGLPGGGGSCPRDLPEADLGPLIDTRTSGCVGCGGGKQVVLGRSKEIGPSIVFAPFLFFSFIISFLYVNFKFLFKFDF
jgi:hypothetical protein